MVLAIQLSTDTNWSDLEAEWAAQCEKHDEIFETFAQATFAVLEPLIKSPGPNAQAFCIQDGESYIAVFQANTALIKGFDTPVMRIRNVTLSPDYDFGEKTVDQYADALVKILFGILKLSDEHPTLQAKRVHFHLRSPNDHQFFRALGKGLNEADEFEAVQMRGAWLYVTKA